MAEKKVAKIVRCGEWEYRVEVEEPAAGIPAGLIRGTDGLRETIFSLQDKGYSVRLVDCDLASEGLDYDMDCCPVCGVYHEVSDLGGCEHFVGLYSEGEILESGDYEGFAEAWQSLEDLYSEIPENQQEALQEDLSDLLAKGGLNGATLAGLDFPGDGSTGAFLNQFGVVMGPETGEGGIGPIGLYARDPALLSARIEAFSAAADALADLYPKEEEESPQDGVV